MLLTTKAMTAEESILIQTLVEGTLIQETCFSTPTGYTVLLLLGSLKSIEETKVSTRVFKTSSYFTCLGIN